MMLTVILTVSILVFSAGLLSAQNTLQLPFVNPTELNEVAQNPNARTMKAKKNDFHSFYSYDSKITEELYTLTPDRFESHPDFGILPYDAPCKDCIELVDHRTETGRYFIKNGTEGTHFYKQEAAGPIHFRNAEEQWVTLDPHLRKADKKGTYRAASQPIPTALNTKEGWSGVTLQNGFELKFNNHLGLRTNSIEPSKKLGDWDNAHVGKDGAKVYNFWKGIDMMQLFDEGKIETDFIIKEQAAVPAGEWLVISDRMELPSSYSWVAEEGTGKWIEVSEGNTSSKIWTGELKLIWQDGIYSREVAGIKKPLLYDGVRANSVLEEGIIGYRINKSELNTELEIWISGNWLAADQRVYPVTVDPLLYGVATYSIGEIGFNYDGTCFDITDYCNGFLTVTAPGRTTLTGAWFDAQYFSVLMGCFVGMTDCLMRDAAFQILGPCSTSPMPGSYWSCLPPEGDSSGTCYGDSLDLFNTIDCIAPQCPDYIMDFEMRTFHCSCNGPNCGVSCHFMPNNTWKITIEGRTVEEAMISSPNFPTFEICAGDTIALAPTSDWGVPGYRYEWEPGGLTGDTIYVSPSVTTTYTSVVFDLCDNTDTVRQEVIVNPAPNPLLGPFEDCFPGVTLDGGDEWFSYFWPHSGETTQTVNVDSAGLYTVIVTDAIGCVGESQPITAIINLPPIVEAFPDTIIIDEGALGQLGANIIVGGSVNLSWAPVSTLTCSSCSSPLAFPTNDQVYFVVGEEAGCIGPPDSLIVIVNQIDLNVPNAFTPNGDGLNDVFRPTNNVLYPLYEMKIYDRWGGIMFLGDDIRKAWDGTYRGKEMELGTYIWVIRYRKGFITGEEVILQGNVTLLR